MKRTLSFSVVVGVFLTVGFTAVVRPAFAAAESSGSSAEPDVDVIAIELKEKVDAKVQSLSVIVDEIVAELNSGRISIRGSDDGAAGALQHRLKHDLGLIDGVYELGFAFEPPQRPAERRLFARAYRIENGQIQAIPTDELVDYIPEADPIEKDVPQHHAVHSDWVSTVLSSPSGVWTEPELDRESYQLRVRYGRRFQIAENSILPSNRGVIYAVWDIQVVDRLLKGAGLGANGFANLRTRKGAFLVHYNWDCIFRSNIENSDEGCEDYAAEGEDIATVAISQTGWELTVKKDAIIVSQDRRRHIWQVIIGMLATILVVGTLVVFAVFYFIKRRGASEDQKIRHDTSVLLGRSAPDGSKNSLTLPYRIVLWSITIGLLLGSVSLLAAYYLWPNLPPLTDQMTWVDSRARFNDFWKHHRQKIYQQSQKLPIAVPTGVFIQSMTFEDANSIRLTGHIWQKYTDGVHDGISRGVILPESEQTTIDHLYTKRTGATELWGWRFNNVVFQEFDYLHYPFGSEDVWIQMWHKDFYSNVVLIPDYDAYKLVLPEMKPGIRHDLEMPGWNVTSTFFGYTSKNYDTSFGLPSFDGVTQFPELYFNVMIEKQIIAPLVSHLLPVVFIWVMMYTILLLSSRYKVQAEAYGFNAMNVVTACAGFFLVVVFCHVDLRRQIVSKEINYLEYYYFIAYVLIIFVITNAIALTLTKFKLAHFKNNLLAKILYWPVLGVIVFIITLRTFY